MSDGYVVYGAAGSGSVPVEATLTLLGEPYRVVERATWASPEEAAEMAKINPLRQVPAVVLPISVLDLYMAAVSRWGPRRRGFYAAAPRLGEIVRHVDAEPRLAAFWAARFPFSDGWEG